MKKIPFLSIIFISLISFLNVFPAYPSDDSPPDKITDISDRKYEQALIDLLDNAKESIVVSMYGISPGAGEKGPIQLQELPTAAPGVGLYGCEQAKTDISPCLMNISKPFQQTSGQ